AVRAVEIWDDSATALPPPLRTGFWRDARRAAVRVWSKKRGQQPIPAASPDALAPLLGNLRALARERNLPTLLRLITDGAVSLTGAERGFVLLTDTEGALEAATIRDAEHELGEQTAAFSRSIAETVLIDGEPVVTVDAVHDARVQDYMSVHQLMLKSVACLPIGSGDQTSGVLYLEHRSMSGRFSGTDLPLLQAYADQAAIALETSRLFQEVERQARALRETNEALRHANEQLAHRLEGRSEELRRTLDENRRLQATSGGPRHPGLVGSSPPMRALAESLERIAASGVPAVVFGESGTGKELVARAIHNSSPRATEPFLSLNCAAIPDGLLESELFGHVVGAFTGAKRSHDGVFAQANGGTLFLDEVADMPPRMQLDLLRILQEGKVRPVGGAEERVVDVRVIAASQRPLQSLVDAGTFRDDLYYRLAVVELRVPPLRERRQDIPQLCAHLLERHAKQTGEAKKSMSRDALDRLAAHPFPGNVRELEHLLINASVFSRSHIIEADELAIETPTREPVSARSAESFASFKGAERARILETLNTHGWNRAKAARALGMPRRTFYRRLKEHAIELPKNG
ncbi:MAG: sigma-54-dependent Fis family transcriptional regulator, partial [Polyangiales bacterium]